MREEPPALELRKLVAHRRGRNAQAPALDEVPRADRLAGRDVLLDHEREQLALAVTEIRDWIRGHLQEF